MLTFIRRLAVALAVGLLVLARAKARVRLLPAAVPVREEE